MAATNNMADAFLHVATQAAQTMHDAASNALSSFFSIGIEFASWEFPDVFAEINLSACCLSSTDLSNKIFNYW